MTEIKKVEEEIKVLQKKLEFLQSIRDHKEQEIKEAYKVAYGHYPETGFAMGEWDAVSWDAFKKGYEAGQPKTVPPDEPYCPDDPPEYDEVEWDEKDNPKTLLQIIREWCDDDNDPTCEELVNRISGWLPVSYEPHGDYGEGWNDCLNQIKDKLK
jgi:hypothetical protein